MEFRVLFKKIHLSTVTRMRDVAHDSLVFYHVYGRELVHEGVLSFWGFRFLIVYGLKDKSNYITQIVVYFNQDLLHKCLLATWVKKLILDPMMLITYWYIGAQKLFDSFHCFTLVFYRFRLCTVRRWRDKGRWWGGGGGGKHG